MATPQIPGGRCLHCGAPVIDPFAEWTEEYQTATGKRDILAGDVVFDCYFCEGPLQLALPLAIVVPQVVRQGGVNIGGTEGREALRNGLG